MTRRMIVMLLAGAFALSMAAGAFAQDGGEGRGGRRKVGDRRRGNRGDQRDRGQKMDPATQHRRMAFGAIQVMHAAAQLPAAKEINEKFAKEMREMLGGGMKDLRERIRKAKEGGADREAIMKMIKEAREAAQQAMQEKGKQLLAVQIRYCKALLDVAENNQEALAKQLAESRKKMMERIKERRGKRGDDRGRNRRGRREDAGAGHRGGRPRPDDKNVEVIE